MHVRSGHMRTGRPWRGAPAALAWATLAGATLAGATLVWGAAPSLAAADAPSVVYGSDNRKEAYTLTGFREKAAKATVALVDAADTRKNKDGSTTLLSETLGQRENLCAGERFARQPTAAFCSGVLVGKDLVATAGHCVDEVSLPTTRFVFSYRMLDAATPRTRIAAENIYEGKSVLARKQDNTGADYALVRLTRAVSGRAPLKIARTKIAGNAPIYVLGYPTGLPLKFADGARVMGNGEAPYFTANLDTFAGNSGSPVFDAGKYEVAGILVRGEQDYTPRGQCSVVNRLSDSAGGEEATRTTLFAAQVPPLR